MRVLDQLREELAHREGVRLAMLFGSRARGLDRGVSDVDLAVEASGVDLLSLAADLSLAVGSEVDVVDLAEAGYPQLKAILRDGICVHEGNPGGLARWRARTIAQLETDRPWFERMRDAFLKRQAEATDG
jgi:predicted nucleotidyltransferase